MFKQAKGYNLLEVIVGISILIVGILSILSISVKLIKAQDYVKNKELAIVLSQEGIEAISLKLEDNFNLCHIGSEAILNTWNCWGSVTVSSCTCSDVFDALNGYAVNFDGINWTISSEPLSSWNVLYYNCVGSDPCYYSHTDLGVNSEATIYERKISVDATVDYDGGNDDMVQISSVVKWEERGDYKYVTTTSEFYNWRWRKE